MISYLNKVIVMTVLLNNLQMIHHVGEPLTTNREPRKVLLKVFPDKSNFNRRNKQLTKYGFKLKSH